MKRTFFSFVLSLFFLTGAPADEPADLTIQGKSMKSARLSKVTPEKASVMHSSGSASFLIESLTPREIAALNATSSRVAIPANWKEILQKWKAQVALAEETRRKAMTRPAPSQPAPPATSIPPSIPRTAQPPFPVTPPNPVSTPAPNRPAAAGAGGPDGLKLSETWEEPYGGKTAAQADLTRLFAGVATGRLDTEPHRALELVRGVYYLMPLDDALKQLGATAESTNGIPTPGFPNRSLFAVSVSGNFGEGFNRMNLVCDRAKQVVSVQFLNQSPGTAINRGAGNNLAAAQTAVPLTAGWKVYNFVSLNKKGTTGSSVQMGIAPVAGKAPGLYQIDSLFVSGGRVQEIVRWYVPQPIAELLHHCASLKPDGLSTGSLGGASGF